MGKRGPKPPDFGLLMSWEFEFYKAFHLLRDGQLLPSNTPPPSGFKPPELRRVVEALKRMSPEVYWLTSRRVANGLGENVNLHKPPVSMDLAWAERQKAEEIFWLERTLNPPRVGAVAKRRKVWNDLFRANTYAALRKACGRWAQLPDLRCAGMTPFPQHVVQNAAQFLFMKRNKRFPRSNYGDESRLEYLARGMAGVLCGVSPMTSIERLRNMNHGSGGPFWTTHHGDHVLASRDQYCACWRCRVMKPREIERLSRTWCENGLKLFMGLAAATKVPREWKAMRSERISSQF